MTAFTHRVKTLFVSCLTGYMKTIFEQQICYGVYLMRVHHKGNRGLEFKLASLGYK